MMWAVAVYKQCGTNKVIGYKIVDSGSQRYRNMDIRTLREFHTNICNIEKSGSVIKLKQMNPDKRKRSYYTEVDTVNNITTDHMCIITSIENGLISYVASTIDSGVSVGEMVSLSNISNTLRVGINDLRFYNGYLENTSDLDRPGLKVWDMETGSYRNIENIQYGKSVIAKSIEWDEAIESIDYSGKHLSMLRHIKPVKKASIPSDIASIKFFKGNVKELELGNSLISIHRACFKGLRDIEKIDFGGIETIPENCCKGSSLMGIRFSMDTKRVLSQAFMDCTKLTGAVVLGARKIGDKAFMNTNIQTLKLIGIESIGESAFENCRNLRKVTLDTDKLTEIKPYTFRCCESLEEIEIPRSVERVSELAFTKCLSLKKITMYSGTEIVRSKISIGLPVCIEWK